MNDLDLCLEVVSMSTTVLHSTLNISETVRYRLGSKGPPIGNGIWCYEKGCSGARTRYLSQNGTPVNIVYHSRNADTAAFLQISSYYKKVTVYTKFGQLVLRKIIESVATRCHILRLKCTKFDFRWGAHSTPPDHLAGLKGNYF